MIPNLVGGNQDSAEARTSEQTTAITSVLRERRSRRRLASQLRRIALLALLLAGALAWKHAWSAMGLWMVQAWLFRLYAGYLTRFSRDPEEAPLSLAFKSFAFKFRVWWGDWRCRHGRHRWRTGDWKRRCLRCGLKQHLETIGWCDGPFMWQTLHNQSTWAETNLFGEDIGP